MPNTPFHIMLPSSRLSPMPGTAGERVIAIAELLDAVLGFLGPPDLASCAQVCRVWEAPALRLLWHDISDCKGLFDVLGDLNDHELLEVS